MSPRARKILRRTLIGLLGLYLVAGLLLYGLQDLIFFHPAAVARDYRYQFSQPYTELNLAIGKRNLNIIQFSPAGKPKGIVLFFHGNMRNVQHYGKYAALITARGYELWMSDYPGFGKSTGKLTEERCYSDALLVYRKALETYPAERVVIYGKSIGTGVASFLASERKSSLLILETPYYNIRSMAKKYLPLYPFPFLLRYRFPNNEHLKKVQQRVVLFHGSRDELIPFSQAARLHLENPNSVLVEVKDGGHNNLSDFPVFRAKLDSVLR